VGKADLFRGCACTVYKHIVCVGRIGWEVPLFNVVLINHEKLICSPAPKLQTKKKERS